MTVGEAAGKMNVTVRTLQYYDKRGLLPPSGQSAGGRRLYTDKDLVKLHQILSLKGLGFSLDEIKESMLSLDKPEDVAALLKEQAAALRRKITELAASLNQIEKLRAEVLKMQTVDFKKYADIIINLQLNNDYYHLIKYFDEERLEELRTRFDRRKGADFMERFGRVNEALAALQAEGFAPDSGECQAVIAEYWALITEFTDGDMRMVSKLMELAEVEAESIEEKAAQEKLYAYIGPALGIYLENQGITEFGGAS